METAERVEHDGIARRRGIIEPFFPTGNGSFSTFRRKVVTDTVFVREVSHGLIDTDLSAGLISSRVTGFDPIDFGGHGEACLSE